MKDYKLIFAEKFMHHAGDTVAPHDHKATEIVLYTGEGETVIGDTAYTFRKNSVAVTEPGVTHSETHKRSGSVIYFGVDFSESDIPVIPSGVYTDIFSPEVPHITERIYEESRRSGLYSEELISAKITELLIFLRRGCDAAKNGGRDLRYCMNYIVENCCGKIDFRALAEGCGYGYEYFRHIFKKEFGISPQKAVIRERLLRAKALLEMGEASCTEAAMMCGFSDSSQFSRMFTSHFGVKPRNVKSRKNHRPERQK